MDITLKNEEKCNNTHISQVFWKNKDNLLSIDKDLEKLELLDNYLNYFGYNADNLLKVFEKAYPTNKYVYVSYYEMYNFIIKNDIYVGKMVVAQQVMYFLFNKNLDNTFNNDYEDICEKIYILWRNSENSYDVHKLIESFMLYLMNLLLSLMINQL
jgi:hypothetical protein